MTSLADHDTGVQMLTGVLPGEALSLVQFTRNKMMEGQGNFALTQCAWTRFESPIHDMRTPKKGVSVVLPAGLPVCAPAVVALV